MTAQDYSTQIKSPRWQMKRLQIMSRDKAKCRLCGDGETTLHVHHLYYVSGKKIYDYDDESLVTLCSKCHDSVHNELAKISSLIAFAVIKKGMSFIDISEALNIQIP